MDLLQRVQGALAALRGPQTLNGLRLPGYVRRFSVDLETARPPVAGRLLDWQTTTPQYPPANYRTFVTYGFRHNAVFRRCVEILSGASKQAWLTVVDKGTRTPFPGHPALYPFRQPAPRVTEKELWTRFVQDAFTTGNALWEKVRSVETGEVIQLWRLEPSRVAIEPDPYKLVRRYLYNVNGSWYPIDPRDVLHWKFPDPLQPFFGLPPIYSAFRDLAVDNQIVDHFKVVLQNLAVPAVVLEHTDPVTEPEAEEAKRAWMRKYGGFRLGEPAVVGGGTKVNVIGMDLQKMAIGDLVATSESRIAMVHGVPMILLGRSGTQADPTRANYAEAKEHFWFDTVLPMLAEIAEQVSVFLLPEFDPEGRFEAEFDVSDVPIVQEAKLRRGGQATKLFTDGLISRHRAQRLAGVEIHGPDVFYRSANVGAVIPAAAVDEVIELEGL